MSLCNTFSLINPSTGIAIAGISDLKVFSDSACTVLATTAYVDSATLVEETPYTYVLYAKKTFTGYLRRHAIAV